MASRVLYPPIVDSYMPAFDAGSGSCRIYFSLSKFNANTDFVSVHASVVKQGTGMNVVKTTDSGGRYRSTGIILNIVATKVEDQENLYYITINNDDLSSKSGTYNGWIPGWIYKVQIRLSAKNYDGSVGQAAWLNGNASYFSEWSTVCVLKATAKITYAIPIMSIDTGDPNDTGLDESRTLYISTLNIFGHFNNSGDKSEIIDTYQFTLYDNTDNILEESGLIYANQFEAEQSFNYVSKTELIDGATYKLAFKYETINHYIDGNYKFDEFSDERIEFTVSQVLIDVINCTLVTADNDANEILKDVTSVHEEEEEGRIGLKLYSSNENPYSGNICIRRADSRDNFRTWHDIKIYVAREQVINAIPLIYDYTIESGVWYKYGVQSIDKDGNRGIMNENSPIMRNFNYSFLLGKDNKQLKLMFDNTMGSFKTQMTESKVDPIGSTYPIVTRNAATYYKTFPINGLISFWMDENKVFCNKKVIYSYEDVVDLYEKYNTDNNIVQYDYIYERDFRKQVLEFLQDGELKVFKSPTEGNIIVRLMDVNCTPTQSLDRMLYSFTSNAFEMAEASMENYLKYGFYDPGEWSSEYTIYTVKIGQIQGDFRIGENIFQRIYEKYDSQGRNLGGYVKTLGNIHHIKITFDERPLRITNSAGELVIGNNFLLNGQQFTVYSPIRMYEFDNRLNFTTNDNLALLGDAEGKVQTVHATVDFLYDLASEVYVGKQVQSREVKTGIGQLFGEYQSGTNLYNEIYYKYYIEWDDTFRRLNRISSIEIEANPGVVMQIRDEAEGNVENHVINDTGQLRFYEIANITSIKYLGVRDPVTGVIDTTKPADILLNYFYTLVKGKYKET